MDRDHFWERIKRRETADRRRSFIGSGRNKGKFKRDEMNDKFLKELKERGWIEIVEDQEYRKIDWFIIRDTGSWWMVGTDHKQRVFDVPEPNDNEGWMANLIEHLCSSDDRIRLLKKDN